METLIRLTKAVKSISLNVGDGSTTGLDHRRYMHRPAAQHECKVKIWLPLVDVLRTFLLLPTSDLLGILDHPWAHDTLARRGDHGTRSRPVPFAPALDPFDADRNRRAPARDQLDARMSPASGPMRPPRENWRGIDGKTAYPPSLEYGRWELLPKRPTNK